MTEQAPQSGGSEIGRFFGLVLIVIGILWMVASGLCTAAFGIGLLAQSGSGGQLAEAFSIVLLMLVYGGFSALFGFGIYIIGRIFRPRAK